MRIAPAFAFVVLSAISIVAQNRSNNPKPAPQTEYAMSPGMKITATTAAGTIAITALDERTRSYEWDGATEKYELDPRMKRFLGSLGLFSDTGTAWKELDGINRGVLQEGQQHFGSVDEALNWLKLQTSQSLANLYLGKTDAPSPAAVYRDDGLMVVWGTNLSRRQLNADVWQILIDGKKPTSLPGSQDSAITVSFEKKPVISIERNAPTASPNSSDQKKPCGAGAKPRARNEVPADRRSALEMQLKEFNEWAAPGVADLSAEQHQDPSCSEIKSMFRRGQDVFASGAKITVQVPKSIAWPRNDDGKKEVEHVSPEQFVKTAAKLAFTALLRQIATGEPEYKLDKDRATVHQKQFLVDMTGDMRWDSSSVVVDYDMIWVFSKQWQIKELKQTVRMPTEAEKNAIDQILKAAK